MSISNILGFDGKLLPSVFPTINPYPPAAAAGLGQVLAVNNSALTPTGPPLPQSITDVGVLSAADIQAPFGAILAFNSDVIGGGALGNLGIIPTNNLTIKGAQTKGSMLVGNGTSTKELIVPVAPALPDGSVLILDSTAALGVRWGGEAGDINSITPGNNIDITGPTANPIVALKAPLTSTLNMGAVAITDSAGAVGVSGQVLTAGTGGQTLWGTNGVSSITAGTNISITGTASVPIVNLQNPLTATLNAGAQNIQGTSTQITLTNGGSQANVQATLGFTSVLQATPTQKANLFNNQISIETLANKVIIQPTAILKSVGTTAFQVGTVGSAPLNLIGGTGGGDGISLTQLTNVGTTLTTSIANTKFYPDTYISNGDAITIGVPVPQVIHQRLTLNNLGLSNTSLWEDYGGFNFAGYSAFFRDSQNHMWLAEQGTGIIKICDNPPITLLATITMTGDSGAGFTRVNTFYEQGGYVFIGGSFTTINGNATSQGGIARVLVSSYLEDPMFNSSTTESGIQGGEVFDMTDVAGVLEIVGSFNATNNGSSGERLLTITDPYVSSSGTQTFIETNGGANNTCYTILFEPSNARVYYGGDFTNIGVNTSPVATNYIAYWDITATTWNVVAGNAFGARVSKIVFNTGGTLLYVVGSFSITASTYNCYLDLLTTAAIDSNLNLSTDPNYQQAFSSGFSVAVMDGTTFYREDSFQVWTSLGIPDATGTTITGINYDTSSAGDFKVIYNNYPGVRSHSIQPHSCVFTGSFKYDNTSYGNYTIVPRNVSQQFIGDATCSFWSIIGVGVGTFS